MEIFEAIKEAFGVALIVGLMAFAITLIVVTLYNFLVR